MKEALRVFAVFLGLGCRAFGGPVAHLGYFHALFVVRRGWLAEARYAELVALCHALPGPSSSQVAAGIGHARAGVSGAVAAMIGFALPSAAAMTLLGLGVGVGGRVFDGAAWHGLLQGLALVALVVVAQALLTMARTLAPDAPRRAIALLAALMVAGLPPEEGQPLAIATGAMLGLRRPGDPGEAAPPRDPHRAPPPRAALAPLLLFALLVLLAVLRGGLFGAFFRAGALVFGGGHVVLPLLQAALVPSGRVAGDVFLAGYGAAQAMPGPLFTVAAFLGAAAGSGPRVADAAVALLGIFLPGVLLLLAALPFALRVAERPAWRGALAGVGAAVVGLLAASLAGPIGHAAIRSVADAVLALAGLVLAMRFRVPPLALVAAFGGGGLALGLASAD